MPRDKLDSQDYPVMMVQVEHEERPERVALKEKPVHLDQWEKAVREDGMEKPVNQVQEVRTANQETKDLEDQPEQLVQLD